MSEIRADLPLTVVSHGGVFGSLTIPLSRLEEVKAVLDKHPIRYFVDENAMSIDGAPYMISCRFRAGSDFKLIQSVIDAEL